MDEILHTPREESSAIRPPLAQLRDRWEAGTAALAQRVEPLRRRLDAATAGGRRLINPLHFLAAAVVIGVAAVVGTVYTPSYVVEVDGVALGTVTSPSVFEDVGGPGGEPCHRYSGLRLYHGRRGDPTPLP